MAVIIQQTAVWTEFPGAPGYSNFYHRSAGTDASSAQSGADAVHDFFAACSGSLPATVRIDFDPVCQIIEETTGQIQSEVVVATPPAQVAGTNAGGYASNSGVGIDWITGRFVAGRLLRGRTYLVPAAGCFDTDGTVTEGVRTALAAAALNIVATTMDFVVWHRPVNSLGGFAQTITSAIVRDRGYVLRSRGI